MQDFLDISYLKAGTDRQKQVYNVLQRLNILNALEEYKPILIGSIALNLDFSNSDVDLICQFTDKNWFKNALVERYRSETAFELTELLVYDVETVICSFFYSGFQIEIFGQSIPTNQQMGYKHLLIENALLNKYGEVFRQKIIHLKQEGLKTEVAFCRLLGLSGNPYFSLLNYKLES